MLATVAANDNCGGALLYPHLVARRGGSFLDHRLPRLPPKKINIFHIIQNSLLFPQE